MYSAWGKRLDQEFLISEPSIPMLHIIMGIRPVSGRLCTVTFALFQILFSLASSPEVLGIIPIHSRQRLGTKADYGNRPYSL